MLTDFILNNEAGSTWIMQLYGANTMSDGGLIDNSRNYAVADGEVLMEMNNVWDVSDYYDGEYDWRNGIQLNDSQTGEVNNLSGDINTYYAENYSQFLVGDKPLSEWDTFIQTMMDMGLSRIYEIYDEAYQTYLSA
jgi:putative aldouronate transport system substrate-binding protein